MIKRAVAAALFLAALFYWLIEGGGITPAVRQGAPPPVTLITGGVLSEDKDGKKNWLLNVERIEVDITTGQSRLTGIDGKLYRPDGSVVDVTANSGLYDTKTKEVVLTGDVSSRYSEGWTLNCQEIRWLPSSDLIAAAGQVKIAKGGLFASGDRVETDRALTRIKIIGHGVVRKTR